MTLVTSATYNTLDVCAKCGWAMAGPYETERHTHDCQYVAAGVHATALAAALPQLTSTKFGYGTGHLMDEDLHVKLRKSAP